MSKILNYALGFLLLVLLGAWSFSFPSTGKSGFVLNDKLFKEYKGTLDLENRLSQMKLIHQHSLDSLSVRPSNYSSFDVQKLGQEYRLMEETTANEYTADLWIRINAAIKDYGKDNDYDFIYGANGNGGLMYGSESLDLTEELIHYLNARYDSKK